MKGWDSWRTKPRGVIVVEVNNEIVAAAVQARMISRAGAHALAAAFVILLTAFGVFCRYDPWRCPKQLPILPPRQTICRSAIQAWKTEDGFAKHASEEVRTPSKQTVARSVGALLDGRHFGLPAY